MRAKHTDPRHATFIPFGDNLVLANDCHGNQHFKFLCRLPGGNVSNLLSARKERCWLLEQYFGQRERHCQTEAINSPRTVFLG